MLPTRVRVVWSAALLVLSVSARLGEAASSAHTRWKAILEKYGSRPPSEQKVRQFMEEFNADIRGPLRGSHLDNEFGMFSAAEWSVYLETLGYREPPVMKWPRSDSPAAAAQPPALHTVHTARAKLDLRGRGHTLQTRACRRWEPLLAKHAKLQHDILDPHSNLAPSARRVLQIGSGGGGLGNRLGPYLTWFLLCVVTKRACLIDERQAAMKMSHIFGPDTEGGHGIDWLWTDKLDAQLRAAGLRPKPFHLDPKVMHQGELSDFFKDAGPWAYVPQALQQDLFGSTALLHSAFGMAQDDPGNSHLQSALANAGLGNSGRADWLTPGCLARWLFQPKPHVVDAMAPYVDMFDKSGYVIGIHVRLGFLVPGAGADSQVEPNVTVSHDIMDAMRMGFVASDKPWRGFDEWIHRAGTALWQNQPPGVPRQALSTLFECAEHLANEAVAQDSTRKPIFFLATDSPHVEQLAKLVYSRRKNDPESSLRPQLVTTQYDAVHSMQANTVTKQVGIAADWWLLTMVDELVAPGSIQSTFSGSAWHVSLRADQLKHVDYRGKCLRGGGPPFDVWGLPDYPNRGKGYYRHDDAALSALRNGPPEIELKIHHEL